MKFYDLEKNRSESFDDGAPPHPGPQQRNHGHLKPVDVTSGQPTAKNIMPEF